MDRGQGLRNPTRRSHADHRLTVCAEGAIVSTRLEEARHTLPVEDDRQLRRGAASQRDVARLGNGNGPGKVVCAGRYDEHHRCIARCHLGGIGAENTGDGESINEFCGGEGGWLRDTRLAAPRVRITA